MGFRRILPCRVQLCAEKCCVYAKVSIFRSNTEQDWHWLFCHYYVFPEQITAVFTTDETVIRDAPNALRWVFLVTPLIAVQMIGSGYFQAIGKAVPALLLTLTKQGFFLIPLILILPQFYGIFGVWVAFPIADLLATIVTGWYLNREIRRTLNAEQV
ncbi:uncharacterized membrane protein [Kordia algicida OT-1]|uniref:Uncharacterized membrane protein n=1 Tax=Kordia algicida OT-1 TaxID=391587 RepID=A9DN04_9FLAO|nr:MATE family efflux transporter [Kordia algicida]EDP97085.1 uncharacterized membrane protein [Kordia algicida OT-1]